MTRNDSPILSVRDLRVTFGRGKKTVHAVAGLSFDLFAGETLGLVGESGCGKSTTGRAIMQIEKASSGSVMLGDVDLLASPPKEARRLRTRLQMIFQDPVSSLNPRRKVRDIVAEPFDYWKSATGDERTARVDDLLRKVGIDPDVFGHRYARQFSGGQCQRISIARALAMSPEVLICDEVVSALDVSVQAQILNLLEDLKAEFGLSMLFIAHDLAVVKNISDRVAVMYLGKIVEIGPSDDLYVSPHHPYSELLLSAVVEIEPETHRERRILQGEPPSPSNPPSGCRFRTRCPFATDRCATEEPELNEIAPGRFVACHFPRNFSQV
jgi:peptide/nickel transport system ATP-binding protein